MRAVPKTTAKVIKTRASAVLMQILNTGDFEQSKLEVENALAWAYRRGRKEEEADMDARIARPDGVEP
jgi:hypothetical protein